MHRSLRGPVAAVVVIAAFVNAAAAAPPSSRSLQHVATIAARAERPGVDAAKDVIRIGLRPRGADPRVRDAAVTALRGMSGDEETAAFLSRTFAAEWQRGNAEVVVGLALALLPVEDAQVAGDVLGAMESGLAASPRGAPVVEAIAMAAAGRADAAEVTTLRRLAELGRFRDDFAYRRGLVACLAAIPRPEAVEALIRLLRDVPGEVRVDIVRFLTAVSGEQHGLDAVAWERWWEGAKDSFRFPDRMVLPAHEGLAAATSGDYYGIPLYAQNIVFVIDTSGSMEGPRFAAAKRELIEAITGLDPVVRFNVVAFDARPKTWQGRLVTADPAARVAAARFVTGLVADGATATCDALETAFGFDAEAIFLLSDGQPTAGRIVHPADLFGHVARENATRRISLYTIGVMPDAPLAAFLRTLAERNQGCYRQVDR